MEHAKYPFVTSIVYILTVLTLQYLTPLSQKFSVELTL